MEEESPSSSPPTSDSASPGEASSQNMRSSKRRKTMKPRSEVWTHFEKLVSPGGDIKSKCVYCGKIYASNPKKNGTTSLKYHIAACNQNPENVNKSQSQIVLDSTGGEGNILAWKFDQEATRKALANMIVIDELPFRVVESEGFKHFLRVACPRFQIPSRRTIARDVYQLYLGERGKLKQFIKNSCQRICLTTDTWTSLQRINYMCLTAHFIDNDWKLHKKIINFCQISSHKGEAIAKLIEKCLLSWGIDKVFSITLDNASANDVAVNALKIKFGNKNGSILNGRYMHMRCVAHIVNLIVNDGLKDLNVSVARVRGAVRYVRGSPSRLQKFKDCVENENIESKSLLCLDVSTRWNSTYLMLNAAQKFEKAFERFELQDEHFRGELESMDGFPTEIDWKIVRDMVQFLETFYEITLRVSASSSVTSNTVFYEICEIDALLQESQTEGELDFSVMAMRMKDKFDKYWGSFEKLNMCVFVAAILDPRNKMKYVSFAIKNMFEGDRGVQMEKKVREAIHEMYSAYMPSSNSGRPGSSMVVSLSSSGGDLQKRLGKKRMQQKYEKHIQETGDGKDQMSELDKYLNEETEPREEDFDILLWWRVNSPRFPTLSCMARDVLAIPVSTVASEAAFSTGGRVLDSFRSSLTPKMAQALVLYQDWIRGTPHLIDFMEELQDFESVENGIIFICNTFFPCL